MIQKLLNHSGQAEMLRYIGMINGLRIGVGRKRALSLWKRRAF
ncbi:hypothetical protein QY97_02922 [Bacillus thermotolerans]|uniref:Uncharacterized protein n=1 Tax=Bacillus thermotolerans TaxID=1221996 RepID=A0A0F5HKS1_BACTR|nr:hypothetical protein QY97_02922 [Bacillus thermotolerans]KKB35370.1 hypothetical protein QY95_03504 [Bacillus thermotolerans]